MGPSGGGKTTMIRLLLGLIRPAEGRAYLQAADGRQVEANAQLNRKVVLLDAAGQEARGLMG